MVAPILAKIVPITAQSLSLLQAFNAEPLAVRQNIACLFQGRRYARGAALITQKDPDYGVFFVLSGSVRVTYLSKRGREVSFRDVVAGEMFGELSTLADGVRSAQVIATSNITIARLARERFVALAYSQPRFADYVMRYLAHLVRLLTERVVEMSTLGVANHIHAELLRLARGNGAATASATIDFNRDEIARRISTHREAVSRDITVMEKSGLLKRMGRSSLLVTDVKRLEAMVEEVAGRENALGTLRMAQIAECTNGSVQGGRLHGSGRAQISANRVLLIRVFSVGDALRKNRITRGD